MLPSDALILPDERESNHPKKKGDKLAHPKSTLLSHLGVDYLGQFAKLYGMEVDFSLHSDSEKAKDLVQLMQKVMQDTERTYCILTSIVFYLLHFCDQSECLQEITEGIFQTLLKTCGLPDDLQWVCTTKIYIYVY